MELRDGLAYLSAEEMKQADEQAIAEYGIDVLSLMENAGRQVAALARQLLGGTVASRSVGVFAGKGNNGGDGLVAARHLHDWGADLRILLSEEGGLGDVPARQLAAVKKAGVPVFGADGPLEGLDLLLDSLLGYNSRGNPREPVGEMIRRANASGKRVLAVDIPSGLDATSGNPNKTCIVAESTITLGFPKTGFLNPRCRSYVGALYLGDVSIPKEICSRFGQTRNPFERDSLVRIW